MRSPTVAISDLVVVSSVEHEVLDVGLKGITLKNLQTLEVSVVTRAVLADLLPVRPDTGAFMAPELDRASGEQLAAARALAAHIEEVLTGKHPDHEELDPLFALNVPMGEKDAAKARQLTRAGFRMSARTFRRKREDYTGHPSGRNLAALLDGRSVRITDPWASIPDDYIAAITDEIRVRIGYSTTTSRPTRIAVMERVEAMHPDETVVHPNNKTLNKWIKVVDRDRMLSRSARQRHSIGKRPKWVWRSRPAIAPGLEVQIDSSKFDVMCRTKNGSTARGTLVAMIDKRTRTVLATGVYVSANKGIDLAHLLARALRPRSARQSRFRLPSLDLPRMPWMKHLGESELRDLDTRVPFIFPERIMVDNGADYRSEVFRSACAYFGISLSFAPSGSPTYKAVVEHFFDVVSSLFAERLPGYIARESAHRRRRDPDPATLLTIDELADLFEEWVTVVWQNRPNGGLRDPYDRRRSLSPNAAYLAAMDVSDPVPLPITGEQYLSLLPVQYRKIRADGIELGTYRYDSEELALLRGRPSGDRRHNDRWEVRHDEWDLSAVWVHDTSKDRWIECERIDGDARDAPFGEHVRKRTRRILRQLPIIDDEAASNLIPAIVAALPESRTAADAEAERRDRAMEERRRSGAPERHRLFDEEHLLERRFDVDDFIPMDVFDPARGAR